MSVVWRVAALLSLIVCSPVRAETILKCVDAAGNVTFTQTRCPPELKLESSSEVVNVPPGGGNEVVKMAEPPKPPAEPAAAPPAPVAAAPQASSVGERPAAPDYVPSQYDYPQNTYQQRGYQQNGYGGYPLPWPPYGNGWNQHHQDGNGPRPPRPPLPYPAPGQGAGQNRPPAPRPSNNVAPSQPPHGSQGLDPRSGG